MCFFSHAADTFTATVIANHTHYWWKTFSVEALKHERLNAKALIWKSNENVCYPRFSISAVTLL